MLPQPLNLRACHDVSLTTHATSSRVWQGRARNNQVYLCTTEESTAAAGSAAAEMPQPARRSLQASLIGTCSSWSTFAAATTGERHLVAPAS